MTRIVDLSTADLKARLAYAQERIELIEANQQAIRAEHRPGSMAAAIAGFSFSQGSSPALDGYRTEVTEIEAELSRRATA